LNVEASISCPSFLIFGISQRPKLEKGLIVGLFWANFESFNPDSAVEMGSHAQGANLPQRRQCILPLSGAAAVSALRNDVKRMEAASRRDKDFETDHSGVFAAPGSPLAHFLTANPGLKPRPQPNNLLASFKNRTICQSPGCSTGIHSAAWKSFSSTSAAPYATIVALQVE
jgi:hypothetical protein